MSMVGVPGGIKESTMSLYEDPLSLSTPTIVFECQPAREPLHFRLPYLFSPSSILDHAAFLLRFRMQTTGSLPSMPFWTEIAFASR
ncbi:hypothetical protein [Priestia megaterium]|uniref:hypothetical protein n=1 Tax=Priestia megaterium TaxID=1404 RepID=UPI002795739F|nr:hypothetical protein [Priestia megaterium]